MIATPARAVPRVLALLLIAYAAASLVHFVHNAEFIADYPNLPSSWARSDVYVAWLGLTALGGLGWLLLSRGAYVLGLVVVMAYALLGVDSLGHYVLAPMHTHTLGMNATILLEVTAAGLVLLEAVRLMARRFRADVAG